MEKLWDEYFTWSEFPKRYWAETEVYFNAVLVKVINVHITSNYQDQLRFVLLKRMEQLVNEPVVLLRDFNAAFSYQMENVTESNHLFLSLITDKGYKEFDSNDKSTIRLPQQHMREDRFWLVFIKNLGYELKVYDRVL